MGLLNGAVSDERLQQSFSLPEHHSERVNSTIYGSHAAGAAELGAHDIPDEEMDPRIAYRLIKDDLALDGIPALNLASFVNTFQEEEAIQLMTDTANVNFIDYEEYPSTVMLHNRCVNMIANLFNAPRKTIDEEAIGVSTIGSSEAIILAVLAMKKRWRKKREAEGKDFTRPNLVMNSAVQVCWEKATRYLEVEEKFVNCTETRFTIDPIEAVSLCDENTIGAVAILGTTYTGEYEDVQALAALLDKKQKETGLDIPIHVDAASGGFVAPFVNPGLVWDFRVPRVVSINTSGHKYGLAAPGVGWALWRNKKVLPEELVFHVNYLGSDQASFTINFSKSASQVIAQYYVFIRNGKAGYKAIMENATATADWLQQSLEKTGRFVMLAPGGGKSLPLVAFKLKPGKHYDEFAVAAKIREKGWIIPAYTMAPKASNMKLLRVVIRQDMSRGRAEILLRDIEQTCDFLDSLDKTTIDVLQEHHLKTRRTRNRHQLHAVNEGQDHSLQGKTGKTHSIC